MKITKTGVRLGVFSLATGSAFVAALFSISALTMPERGFADSNADLSRTILFVHGFNPFGLGEDCQGIWGLSKQIFPTKGFTGSMVTIGYYSDDPNCDVMSSKGSILTNIRDLSHDLAWTIYNGWSAKGETVNVVAHSMGGLMTRYALYRVAVGDQTYPPYLNIAHVSTVGTPYQGYDLFAELCHVNVFNVQCDMMAPYSPFIKDLQAPEALLPQGMGGTIWANIGSNADVIDSADGVVTSASATSMTIPETSKQTVPWYKLVFHTEYYHNSGVVESLAASLLVESQTAVSPAPNAPDDSRATCEVLPAANEETPVTIFQKEELASDFSKLPQCNRPGRISPHMVKGVRQGVSITEIRSGGLFDRMGIKNGDVVVGCDAETLDRPFEAIGQLSQAHGPGQLTFCVIHNGHQTTHQFTVE